MHPFSEWLMMNVGSKQAEQALDIVEKMLRDEREACAKTAETIGWSSPTSETEFALREAAKVIAAKIRNRTN
jgi:hypothetical protein